MSLLSKYFNIIWTEAEAAYKQEILSLVEVNPAGRMVDLGCDNGEWTQRLARAMQVKNGNLYGIDLIPQRYKLAVQRGVNVSKSNLNNKLPYKDNFFSFVHANQVIEHLWQLDTFVSEVHRVLKKGGYAIICTENLASWHNIGALLLGYQPFSLTNISFTGAVGNPLALHNGELGGMREHGSWHHTRVLAFQGLVDIFNKHGFKVESATGHGYFPLPTVVAKFIVSIDPKHCAFPIVKIRK